MKTITVTTAQKVTIDFELATLLERILGFIIDFIAFVILMVLLRGLYFSLGGGYSSNADYYYFLIFFPIYTFYTFYWEYFNNGRTPGKMIMGLRVVRENGEQPTITNYLNRWLFRLVDIWLSSGFIAAMFVASTDKSQRLGEVVSGTITIRTRPKYSFSLNDILNIGTNRDSYEPVYPAVAELAEEDLLLIKKTLERWNAFNNEASRKAVNALTHKMCEVLELDRNAITQNEKAFLETLVKDYIMLTR